MSQTDFNWVTLEQENAKTTLRLGDASVEVGEISDGGVQMSAYCFVDNTTLAGVDSLGWLRLWDARTGKSTLRTLPMMSPAQFKSPCDIRVVGSWALNVDRTRSKIEGYRFPEELEAIGHGYPQNRLQPLVCWDFKRLWIHDLVTHVTREFTMTRPMEQDEWNEIDSLDDIEESRSTDECQILSIKDAAIFNEELHLISVDSDAGELEPNYHEIFDLKDQTLINRRQLTRFSSTCGKLRPGYPGHGALTCDHRESGENDWLMAFDPGPYSQETLSIELPRIRSIAYSADGSIMAVICDNGELWILSADSLEVIQSGHLPFSMRGHHFAKAAISPFNCRVLVSTANDAAVSDILL